DDQTALTFELRDDATFHDGTELDAEAVKVNLERGRDEEGSVTAPELEIIEDIEVEDSYTVTLHLASPNSSLLGMLANKAGAIVSPEAFDNSDLNEMPVGSGPYEVTAHSLDNSMELERFEGYWGDEPNLAK